jgi:hypothetical protein
LKLQNVEVEKWLIFNNKKYQSTHTITQTYRNIMPKAKKTKNTNRGFRDSAAAPHGMLQTDFSK